jgi:integrase/recombinase XerD
VDFELRDCRRAYGQRYINNGARIEAVSMSMGHKNIGTTTKYYAGITNRMAIAELDGKWSRSSGKDAVSDSEEGDE